MSKLTEYLKLIPKGIKNLDKIIEGHRNNIKLENGDLSDEVVDIIIGRRLICSQCPFFSENAVKYGFYKTDRTDKHCTQCGCPTDPKTASLSSNCGIEEHNNRHPDMQIPLRWTKVELP